jgi:hypothetical protein
MLTSEPIEVPDKDSVTHIIEEITDMSQFNIRRISVLAGSWVLLSIVIIEMASAQTSFSSGSTGADGAFNPITSQTVQVPESGIFNFTTVNIPAGVTIKFNRNSRNTPVIFLASGDVTITGIIDVSGEDGTPPVNFSTRGAGRGGPGGFDGGGAGLDIDGFRNGLPGLGPGAGGGGVAGSGGHGGHAEAGSNGFPLGGTGGRKYGSPLLHPLIGGSGGGGGSVINCGATFGGGGGGGAILIASSGTINLAGNAQINARAGISFGCGGLGAGGAVRLAANNITSSANAAIFTVAIRGGFLSTRGYIRLEAYKMDAFLAPITNLEGVIGLGFPRPLNLGNLPKLRIASVGGINAPAMPSGSSTAAPDIVLPANHANPLDVVVEGANIPPGSRVDVIVMEPNGSTTMQGPTLTGSLAASSATANITIPQSLIVLTVTCSFDVVVEIARNYPSIDGERVRRVEVAAAYGGQSRITYITEFGRRVIANE